jgi:hypothetical protein
MVSADAPDSSSASISAPKKMFEVLISQLHSTNYPAPSLKQIYYRRVLTALIKPKLVNYHQHNKHCPSFQMKEPIYMYIYVTSTK